MTGDAGFDGAAWYVPAAAWQWQRVDLSGADRASGVVLGASPDRLVLAVQTPAGPQLRLGRRAR